jgi:hypothetical protein
MALIPYLGVMVQKLKIGIVKFQRKTNNQKIYNQL